MAKYKSFISFMLILTFAWMICGVYVCEAQRTYRTTIPRVTSPKPSVVRDRESRAKRQEIVSGGEQTQEAAEAEEILTGPPGVLVSSEPTKIYYQIAVNDVLYIAVWRVRDLSLEFIVGPDGRLSFPLIGDIYAAGRTLAELDDEITEKLKEYVNDPQVSVMVKDFAGERVTVIGEVKAPGIYKFIGKTSIIDVIAIANGFTDKARVVGVAIVREPRDLQKDPEVIFVNAKKILKGELRNIHVRPNDIVYVSRTFVSNLKEFYDNWLSPLLGTAIDYETYLVLRRKGIKRMY